MPTKERVCVACRAGKCRKHDNPTHGATEAECALEIAQLGFTIVPKDKKEPVTIAELKRVVKGQKIDQRGYVTYPKEGKNG